MGSGRSTCICVGAWDLASPTDLPSRDMLCIVNAKLHGMPCPAPPQISAGSVAKVREVRPGLYRVDGVCPSGGGGLDYK